MQSIGQGVFELKDADESAWYRVVYLARIKNRIFVLDCFMKDSRTCNSSFKRNAKMRNAIAPVNVEIEHVTTDDLFADLGFSPEQAVELTIKSDLHRSLMERVQTSKMTQNDLARVLQIHQPDVSNLLRGKLSLFSITRLCQFADRLKLKVRIEVEEAPSAVKAKRTSIQPIQTANARKSRTIKRSSTAKVSRITRKAVA